MEICILYILPIKKVRAAKDHGRNYMKDRPPLILHYLRNGLFELLVERAWPKIQTSFVPE